jgi:phage terminase large subunit-like protein
MWDLSCPDWQERIRAGRSLIPDLPLNQFQADTGLAFFDALRLPDVPGQPLLKDAAGPWFRDIVRAVFGSWDAERKLRHVRDIFVLAPKGQSKTSYSAGLMLSAMMMNDRPRAEMLFVGPTQAISDRAYDQAAGMVEADPQLKRWFKCRHHIKTIVHLDSGSELKVKTFDLDILTGAKPVFVLLDELHLLGRNPHTTKVLRQIRGGLEKTPEGLFLIATTQSDDIPTGAFRDELTMARKIRDGAFRGKNIRPMLPVLYEFPDDIARDQALWGNPDNWSMVMPNMGRSVQLESLRADWETEKSKGEHSVRVWTSQHLNIEIGLGLKSDGWAGAEFWLETADASISMDALIDRSECIVVGIDGGGLDDLYGLTVLGRERGSKRWLSWSHAWAHKSVLSRRQTIAATLEGFAAEGELTIVDNKLDDIEQIVEIIKRINSKGLLSCVAVDPEGPYGELVDALELIGINEEGGQVVGIAQGYKLMNSIKTTERKLANGTFVHAPSRLMDWCVSNVRLEPTATAIRATKQNAGDAKIDPWCALMDAATVMAKNPEPKSLGYITQPVLVL